MVVLTHNYPTEENPVAGVFVKQHAERLGASVIHLPYGEHPMVLRLAKLPKLAAYMWRAYRRIRRLREPIVVHWWIPLGWLAARTDNEVHVVCHGTDLKLLRDHRWLARLLAGPARRVARWQCVSPHLAQLLRELYPFVPKDRISVAPMPVDPVFQDRKLPREKFFVSVGALRPLKRHDRAIDYVAEHHPDHRLVIVGEGPLQAFLAEHARRRGVEVSFVGWRSRAELADLFNRAAGLLSFSDHEGYGLVLREARACGCRIIGLIGDGRDESVVDVVVGRVPHPPANS